MKKFTFNKSLAIISSMLLCGSSYGQALVQPGSGSFAAPSPVNSWAQAQSGADVSVPQSGTGNGKQVVHKAVSQPVNYTSFTQAKKYTGNMAENAGYESNPEYGMLYAGTPCDNCYELIGKRTETTKTFVKAANNGGKDELVQSSTMPMHYQDAAGNWRTIKTQMQPENGSKGIYAASEQPFPVMISAAGRYSSIGQTGENIRFNNNLELVYVKPDGAEVSLGAANWTNHTAGDQGVRVINAWPGVDIEMHTMRGAVKTNFYINHAMPAYANGKLLVRDHMQLGKGMSLVSTQGTKHTAGMLEIKNSTGSDAYVISEATVSDHSGVRQAVQKLEYYLGNDNTVDIALPGSYLNKPASAYPVVIDPLVTTATSLTVNGASYNATWAALSGCLYTNPANTPAGCTITDIQFSFEYTSTVPMDECAFSFYLGACRNPGTAAGGLSWSCGGFAGFGAGTCTSAGGAAYSMFSDMASCIPAPNCLSYPLNIQMYFYQNDGTTAACATTLVFGSQPLIITVIGHSLEFSAGGTAAASPTSICSGSSSTLTGTGTYGVPPYTYTWTPGPISGSPVSVSPTATTIYTLTITDACTNTATGTATITVIPSNPITGILSMCSGLTTTLSDATAGGVWTSSTPTVATVSGTGVVTGVASGTSTISYATGTSCVNTVIVTVSTQPADPVAANNGPVCEGSALVLSASSATAGVTYSWSGPGGLLLATTSNVLVVTPPVAGTYTVKASLSATCVSNSATTIVIVNPLPVISATLLHDPETCLGSEGSITMTGLAPNTNYDITYTFNTTPQPSFNNESDGSGSLLLPSLSAGTYSVSVTSLGCSSTIVGPLTLADPPPPVPPIIGSNTPICIGQALMFTGSDLDTRPGGSYSWTGPNGFSSVLQNPEILGATTAAAGTYSLTYTVANCTNSSTADVQVYAPPVLTNVTLDHEIAYGSSIQLDALGALYYYWTPDDGTLSNPNINNPIATPLKTTTYTVYGTNDVGCVTTRDVTITVNTNMNEAVPTAFTPNNDGRNDVFRIKNMEYQKLVDFSVYNRWGQLVYHNTYDPTQGWDGTYNGEPQDMGVYNYSIVIVRPDGTTKEYKGSVTLIR